eukprot:1978076-Amphidinium_carterae.2
MCHSEYPNFVTLPYKSDFVSKAHMTNIRATRTFQALKTSPPKQEIDTMPELVFLHTQSPCSLP